LSFLQFSSWRGILIGLAASSSALATLARSSASGSELTGPREFGDARGGSDHRAHRVEDVTGGIPESFATFILSDVAELIFECLKVRRMLHFPPPISV
jgi:hypothetical protein